VQHAKEAMSPDAVRKLRKLKEAPIARQGLTLNPLESHLSTKRLLCNRTNRMGAAPENQTELAEEIVGRLVRRHSTAAVLFHHAVAERLGLGPTDLQCFGLLRERGAMNGSELATITGLTSGAITGVVARLERAGYIRRESDPHDGRKQILQPSPEGMRDINAVFNPIRTNMATLLDGFDTHQLTTIAEFLSQSTDLIYRHMAWLRAQTQCAVGPIGGTAQTTIPAGVKIQPSRSPKLRRKRIYSKRKKVE
jgi:DNA-binding MarR family transcriptional regulator